MITHFSVKNFRCFKNWMHFSLASDKRYSFNETALNNAAIKQAIVYGENGGGKTNLGYALLDITRHLSQKPTRYPNFRTSYLNGDSDEQIAEFKFVVVINGNEIAYQYGKNDESDIVYESFIIDSESVLFWDRRVSKKAEINLDGAESLKRELSDNVVSLVTYVLNNASLSDSPHNRALLAFVEFVEGMVFFKGVNDVKEFAGIVPTIHKNLSSQIINEFGVGNLQQFLSEAGIEVQLGTYDTPDGQRISQKLVNKTLEFFSVASSGTFALVILFIWLHKMKQGSVSFAYIDEFDAFYHHKLAKSMVKQISALPGQTVLSSHNTSVMSNNLLRPDCYFELKNHTITPLYQLSDREIRKAHNLEKMYRSGAFDE